MIRILKILSLFYFLGCGRNINIYFLVSLSGPEKVYGKEAEKGIKLFYEKIKDKKIKGKKINVIIRDTESDINKIKKIFEEIKEDRNSFIIIGPEISKFAIFASLIAEKNKIPIITPTATNPLVTEGKNFVFRLTYTDIAQGSYLAKFAIRNLKKKKAIILFEAQNPYSEELSKQFEAVFNKEGGEILFKTFYLKGDTSFSKQIENFKKYKPDLIFIPGYVKEVSMFIKEAYKKGLNITFLGGDGWYSPLLISSLKDIWKEGVEAFITSPFSPFDTSKNVIKFLNDFKNKYKETPSFVSALYYDAFNLSVYIIENLQKIDREEFVKNLTNLKNFIGVTGRISFNGKKDPDREVFILKPEEEGFKFITKLYFE
ncbi:MAG: ABC transporter substrate-binding protein [candidate division WOR-3 bacterium]